MRIGYKLSILCFVAAVIAKRPATYEDDEDGYYDSYQDSDSESGYSSSTSPSTSPGYYSSESSNSPPTSSSYSSSSSTTPDEETSTTFVASKRAPMAKRRIAQELVQEEVITVPRKSIQGDSTFLKKLTLFRRHLFEDGDRLEKIFDTVLQTGGDTHITAIPIAKWLPIEVFQTHN